MRCWNRCAAESGAVHRSSDRGRRGIWRLCEQISWLITTCERSITVRVNDGRQTDLLLVVISGADNGAFVRKTSAEFTTYSQCTSLAADRLLVRTINTFSIIGQWSKRFTWRSVGQTTVRPNDSSKYIPSLILWPWLLTFWPWRYLIYKSSYVQLMYHFWASCGCPFLGYDLWMTQSDHISIMCNEY